MLTSNIKFINFKKIKKKIFKNKLQKFKKINFVAEYPLLETLTKNYKYSYSYLLIVIHSIPFTIPAHISK